MALVQPPQVSYIFTGGIKRKYALRVCDRCGEEKYVQLCNPKSTHEHCLRCHNRVRRKDLYSKGYDY